MKEKLLKKFKQNYKDENGNEKERFYDISIVQDTNGYRYRIINLTEMSIWKDEIFETYEEAKNFLDNHPCCE